MEGCSDGGKDSDRVINASEEEQEEEVCIENVTCLGN